MRGLLAHELKGQAERAVPPGDLKAMGGFRRGCGLGTNQVSLLSFYQKLFHESRVKPCIDLIIFLSARTELSNFETKAAIDQEEKQRALAEKVAQATFEQLSSQVENDMAVVRSKLPPPVSAARETAADMKYLRDRQLSLAGRSCQCFP